MFFAPNIGTSSQIIITDFEEIVSKRHFNGKLHGALKLANKLQFGNQNIISFCNLTTTILLFEKYNLLESCFSWRWRYWTPALLAARAIFGAVDLTCTCNVAYLLLINHSKSPVPNLHQTEFYAWLPPMKMNSLKVQVAQEIFKKW